MNTANDKIKDEIHILQQQFRQDLPYRLAGMAALVSSLRYEWNYDVADELLREAHSLVGAGSTFGMPEVSNAARVMQHSVQALMQQKGAPGTTEMSALDHLLTELSTALTAPALVNSRLQVENDIDSTSLATKTSIPHVSAQRITLDVDSLRILIADDDPFGLEHLKLLLEKDGHEVICAENGEQARDLYIEQQPDMVILDVIMPVMDGLEAAKHIKQEIGNRFVPILFLTSLESDDDLINCVDAGGDDFLNKPLNFIVLRTRIHALQRIRTLYGELERYQRQTEEELKLSKHVFESITSRNSGNDAAITSWATASGHFSGDLICYRESRKGVQYVMIGDFTGHGLIAALGAIPVTDVFYTMAKQGFAINEIASEINRKLKLLLPTGRFFAAGFFRIDSDNKTLDYWFGGLPPAILLTSEGDVELLKADKLALGILGSEHFDSSTNTLNLDNYRNLFLYSDGLTEAADDEGNMLGEEPVIESIANQPAGANILDGVVTLLKSFTDTDMPLDDITLLNIDLSAFKTKEESLLLEK